MVTVLVVGLKGLADVAHTVDPEVQHQILNGAVQCMLRAIHSVEGFVTQFAEQGLVALFGAPLAAEDHVLRAPHAALGIQQACAAYIADIQQRQHIALDFGMGLHCGTVVVGAIGDDVSLAYTAQGFTLTLAHRLQPQAQAGAIYVSAAVQQQAAGLFRFEALGLAAFRELPQPISLYACTGRGHLASRLAGFLLRRGESPPGCLVLCLILAMPMPSPGASPSPYPSSTRPALLPSASREAMRSG